MTHMRNVSHLRSIARSVSSSTPTAAADHCSTLNKLLHRRSHIHKNSVAALTGEDELADRCPTTIEHYSKNEGRLTEPNDNTLVQLSAGDMRSKGKARKIAKDDAASAGDTSDSCESMEAEDLSYVPPDVSISSRRLNHLYEQDRIADFHKFTEIRESKISQTGLTAYAITRILPGQKFGPYQGSERPAPIDANMAWEVVDKLGKVKCWIDATETSSNNLKFVRSAKDYETENMVAIQIKEQVYFETIQEIRTGDELLILKDAAFPEEDILPLEDEEEMYKCDLCGEIFRSKVALRRHEKYACNNAMAVFPAINMEFSENNSLDCPECALSFQNREALDDHAVSHVGGHNKRRYDCTLCAKSFNWKSNLLRHQIIHESSRRFACENCDKIFTDPSNLQRHIRTHHVGARAHACHECGKTFATSSGLKQHTHIHSSVKPFTCEVCFKSYTQFSNLCRHKRMHADCRRQIKCQSCGEYFKSTSSLNKHKRFCDSRHITNIFSHQQIYKQPVGNMHKRRLLFEFNPLFSAPRGNRAPCKDTTEPEKFIEPSLNVVGNTAYSVIPPNIGHYATSNLHVQTEVTNSLGGAKTCSGFSDGENTAEKGMCARLVCAKQSHQYRTAGWKRNCDDSEASEMSVNGSDSEEFNSEVSEIAGDTESDDTSFEVASPPGPNECQIHDKHKNLNEVERPVNDSNCAMKPSSIERMASIMDKYIDKDRRMGDTRRTDKPPSLISPQIKATSGSNAIRSIDRQPSSAYYENDVLSVVTSIKSQFDTATALHFEDGDNQPLDLTVRGKDNALSDTKDEKNYPEVARAPENDTPATSISATRNNSYDESIHSDRHDATEYEINLSKPDDKLTYPKPTPVVMDPIYRVETFKADSMKEEKRSPHLRNAVFPPNVNPQNTMVPRMQSFPSFYGGLMGNPFLMNGINIPRQAKEMPLPQTAGVNIASQRFPNKGKDRYTCKYCGKLFPRSANLTRHIRTHTGEQPYSCKYCDRSFSISSNLQRHVRNIHNKEKPFKCSHCDRCFGQQTNLDRHLKKHEHERSLSGGVVNQGSPDELEKGVALPTPDAMHAPKRLDYDCPKGNFVHPSATIRPISPPSRDNRCPSAESDVVKTEHQYPENGRKHKLYTEFSGPKTLPQTSSAHGINFNNVAEHAGHLNPPEKLIKTENDVSLYQSAFNAPSAPASLAQPPPTQTDIANPRDAPAIPRGPLDLLRMDSMHRRIPVLNHFRYVNENSMRSFLLPGMSPQHDEAMRCMYADDYHSKVLGYSGMVMPRGPSNEFVDRQISPTWPMPPFFVASRYPPIYN